MASEFLRSRQQGTSQQASGPNPASRWVNVPGENTTNSQSARKLFEEIASHHELFYRGGAVVELVNEGNAHSIAILKPTAAQSRFERYVTFKKKGKSGDVNTPINRALAEMYLNSSECRELLPKLNGIIRFPLVVETGSNLRLLEKGYDAETGFFVDNFKAPITDMTLQQAVEFLTRLIEEFDFLTPGDHSRAIASLITPALKLSGLIGGPVPADVAEANASQSGKTYRQKMVAAIYNQRPAVVTKRDGGVGGLDETLFEHLVAGRVFIQFDNIRGKLNSQTLESFLTAEGAFPARIPYHGAINIDPAKHFIFISSNGFEATRDLTNRSSIIRIKKRENYHYRTHEGKDTLQMVFEWQEVWYGAVLKVIEHWHEQGKPRTDETRHDFREWCQVLDWIVRNVFSAAPLMGDHEAAKERAASPHLTFLRQLAIAVNEAHQLHQSMSATQLANLCVESEIEIPGLAPDSQHDVEAGKRQVGLVLGRIFGEASVKQVDEFTVTKTEETATTDAGNPQTLKRYSFAVVNPAPVATRA